MSDFITRVLAFIITPIRASRPSASFHGVLLFGLLIAQNSHLKGAECVVRMVPRSSVVPLGGTAIITCTTTLTNDPIVLSRIIPPSVREEEIYSDGRKHMRCGIRCSISREEAGRYVLRITDVITADAGEYLCRDNHGNGNESHAELSIFYGAPQASEALSPLMLCQTFHYRGKADLYGRYIIDGKNVESIFDPTTENRNTSDDHNEQVTSCFDSTSHRDADIKFEVYEVGGNWISPRNSVYNRSETTTLAVETTNGDGGNTTTDAAAPGPKYLHGAMAGLLGILLLLAVLLVYLCVLKRRIPKLGNWKLTEQRGNLSPPCIKDYTPYLAGRNIYDIPPDQSKTSTVPLLQPDDSSSRSTSANSQSSSSDNSARNLPVFAV